jgi:DNA-binding beta-propeller fold protein YncE
MRLSSLAPTKQVGQQWRPMLLRPSEPIKHPTRTVLTAVGVLSVAAALAAPGIATGAGEIAFDGCLANDAAQGCLDLPAAPLEGASGVAVSPDGKSVYVASQVSNSVSHFSRDTVTGRLTWQGCLANTNAQGCVDVPLDPLNHPALVAVSPDGKSVYVTLQFGDGVAQLSRDPITGELGWGSCLNNGGSQGCGDLSGTPLTDPVGVVVTSDGKSVYVASQVSDSIAHFSRDTDTGQILYKSCLANTALDGCVALPTPALAGAAGVAVSADGKSVYVTARDSDGVARFSRTDTGQLSFLNCLASTNPMDGCDDVPGTPLGDPVRVAVSPDDRSVYVASSMSGSISHLARDPASGQLTWKGCLDSAGSQGCVDVPGAPLVGAFGLVVSPDAGSLYVASIGSDSVSHLVRNTVGGDLAWESCLANTADPGCVDVPAAPLDAAREVAVSPDGKSVYVGSGLSNSVAHFRVPDPPGGTPPGGSDTLAPTISRLSLTNRRFRVGRRRTPLAAGRVPVGTTFRYRLSESATVKITIQRRRGGRWRRAGRALTRAAVPGRNRLRFSGRIGRRALRAGVYRARFGATDAAGNRSGTAAVRFRIVRRVG